MSEKWGIGLGSATIPRASEWKKKRPSLVEKISESDCEGDMCMHDIDKNLFYRLIKEKEEEKKYSLIRLTVLGCDMNGFI